MKYKVTKKQENSKLCAVCGIENPFGFETRYYETDTNEVIGIFKTKQMQQSFPGRVHGGVISAILDETIGRAIWLYEPEAWAVTVELTLRYKQPVPLNTTLKCIGRLTRNSRKIFEGTGEILLEDGTVAIEGYGKYWKMKAEQVDADRMVDEGWWVLSEDDPEEIEI